MSRDRHKKPTHRRANAHSNAWFRPSREDVRLYEELIAASRPTSIRELSKASAAAPSTVDHTMRYWTDKGLLRRTYLDKCAWFAWAPQRRAGEMVEALKAASELAQVMPQSPARPGTLSRALRALAKLLNRAATRLE